MRFADPSRRCLEQSSFTRKVQELMTNRQAAQVGGQAAHENASKCCSKVNRWRARRAASQLNLSREASEVVRLGADAAATGITLMAEPHSFRNGRARRASKEGRRRGAGSFTVQVEKPATIS